MNFKFRFNRSDIRTRNILSGACFCMIVHCSLFVSHAQPLIRTYGIGGAGWWIAHNEQPGQEDKSLVEFQAGAGIALGYAAGQHWELGAVAAWDRILGYFLRATGDRVGFRDRIRIAENEAFSIMRYGLYVQSWPVTGQRFRMGPRLSFGLFSENSIHPDKYLFSNRHWWSVAIPMQWELGKHVSFELAPAYYLHSIRESLPAGGQERHTIDKVGGILGLGFNF
ncbi:MAG: hypothetical protein R3B47_13690 [Bacteroidia bacterium]